MLKESLPPSSFELMRLFCFKERFDATINGLFFLVPFLVLLVLYLHYFKDDSPWKTLSLVLMGALLSCACIPFMYALVGHCSFTYEKPEDSEILVDCCKRCYSCSERSQSLQHQMNSELDACAGSARVKCFSCLKSNDQITSVNTPENLLHFSTHPSGERLQRDYVEMDVFNTRPNGPSQVTVDVTNSADSVQKPTEEQTQSKSDSADFGTNFSKDGDMVVLSPEQQESSQELVDNTNAAADSRLDSDDTNAATDWSQDL